MLWIRERLIRDEGATLIAVILVTLLLVGLAALVLDTGEHADTASTRDRNSEIALGVAEAGIDETIAWVQSEEVQGRPIDGCISGTTLPTNISQPAHGTVEVLQICKQFPAATGTPRYVIDTQGTVGGRLGRDRSVRVTLEAPAGFKYAIFSTTAVEVKNNDHVDGDVWANKSITLTNGSSVLGDVTSAEGWIDLQGVDSGRGYTVQGNVWSGDHHPDRWAIRLANNAKVLGDAKASVKDPTDPTLCSEETQANYNVPVPNGARIEGTLTTWGAPVGTGFVGGYQQACTQADPAKPMPVFQFNERNYNDCRSPFDDDPLTCEELTVAQFNALVAADGNRLSGTFVINDPAPYANRVELATGTELVGDVRIFSNTPIVTSNITDNDTDKVFVLMSTYAANSNLSNRPACEANRSDTDCAIYLNNNFDVNDDGECVTAVLAYANNGPLAVKNSSNNAGSPEICGSLYGTPVLMYNNQNVTYDERIQRIIGFGGVTYEVSRWEELSG